jgi:type VI secretion system (T6SS) baseplate-like injector VgrG
MFMNPDLQRHVGKYYGKYSGEVTDNKDDSKMGLIKVKMPTVFDDPDTEVIARPCLPYGHFFVPAVGSKVWIEFEAGNLGYAIWVGVWYPSGTPPQEAALNPPDNRVIQTASGHTIELMDKDGEEKITIKHKGNAFLTLDKNGSVTIANNQGSNIYLNAKDGQTTVTDQHGHLLTMTDDGVTMTNKDGTLMQLKDDTATIMAKNIALAGTSVALGVGAAEPTILGQTFALMYGTHTHPTALGPSGPPVPPVVTPIPWLTSAVVVK